MNTILLYHQENLGLKYEDNILPTRRFVVDLKGFKKENGPSRSWDSYRGRLSTIRPNWTGITTYEGKRIVSHIAIYYAITRIMFETTDSIAECMMNEDGGKGLEITLSSMLDTEGIIKSFLDDSRFYFKYKERKAMPPYENVKDYPLVRVKDIESEMLDTKSTRVINFLHTFKKVLSSAHYIPDEYSAYAELVPECRHFEDNCFF